MIARFKSRSHKQKDAVSSSISTKLAPQPLLPVAATITFGAWMPRTAMHLAEVYEFFTHGTSHLPLSETKLLSLQQALDLQSVGREAGYLEYIKATTQADIEIRYFEDGLILLEIVDQKPVQAAAKLRRYYHEALQPALRYLYSIDSPSPNVSHHGEQQDLVVASLSWPHPRHFEIDKAFGPIIGQANSGHITSYKTAEFLFVISSQQAAGAVRDIIEMQCFFHRYEQHLATFLNLQRSVWGKVTEIRERQHIQPAQLPKFSRDLFEHQRTATLATGHLRQMDAYIRNRAMVANQLELSDHLLLLFHFRFETLQDSLRYLQHLWTMTNDHIGQSMNVLQSLQNRTTNSILSSQRTMLALLAVSALMTWLSTTNILTIDHAHAMAFAAVIGIGLIVAWVVSLMTKHSEFRVMPPPPKKQKSRKRAS